MKILVTGGAANGKSTYGETLALKGPGPYVYLATMRPQGEEDMARVNRHRRLRQDKGFLTVEKYTNVGSAPLPGGGTVLLECLCNLTANEMFDMTRSCDAAADAYDDLSLDLPQGVDAYAVKQVLEGVFTLAGKCDTLILVTNEIGCDGGGYSPLTMEYAATLGYLNARLTQLCDRAVELVCGIALPLKGELP